MAVAIVDLLEVIPEQVGFAASVMTTVVGCTASRSSEAGRRP